MEASSVAGGDFAERQQETRVRIQKMLFGKGEGASVKKREGGPRRCSTTLECGKLLLQRRSGWGGKEITIPWGF